MTQTATPTTQTATIEIFDPALCCSTGVCGTEVDEALVKFAADVAWVKEQGGRLSRHNLAQEPLAFAQNSTVAQMLKVTGESALPLTLIDGQVALAGRYPTRDELARWIGISTPNELNMAQPAPCCCGGKDC